MAEGLIFLLGYMTLSWPRTAAGQSSEANSWFGPTLIVHVVITSQRPIDHTSGRLRQGRDEGVGVVPDGVDGSMVR